MNHWSFLYSLSYFLPLLYGPLIFLFARQVLSSHRLRLSAWLHFVPFALGFLYLILERQFDFFHPMINGLFRSESGMLVQLASITIYHGLAMHHWSRHKRTLKNYFSETHRLQVNWIRQLVVSSFVVCSIIAVCTISYLCASSKEFALSLLVCGVNRFYILVSYTAWYSLPYFPL
jgi:hypothetical protein